VLNTPTLRGVLLLALLVVGWCAGSWLLTRQYYAARVVDAVQQQTSQTQLKVGDVADSVRRNLHYLNGIPALFAQSPRVKKAIDQFSFDVTRSLRPVAEQRSLWINDPKLYELDQFLLQIATNLNVNLMMVINAAGDSVAASNWNAPGTTIGVNFADREYFQIAQKGQPGMQYAVGRTTQVPGLYFSSPILEDGKFVGAVVAKVDVPELAFIVKQTQAYIVDTNGVIILADDKQLEMNALPNALVAQLPKQQVMARYQRADFPALRLGTWGDSSHGELVTVQDSDLPHVLVSKLVPEYGIEVYAMGALPTLPVLEREQLWFFLLIAVLGGALLIAASGTVFYIRSIRRAKVDVQESEKKLRALYELSPLGIVLADMEGHYIEFNEAFRKICGYSAEELKQLDYSTLTPSEYHSQDAEQRAHLASHGRYGPYEKEYVRKNGSRVPLQLNGMLVIGSDGKQYIWSIVQDIEDRQRMDRMKNEFVSTVSHELRTPITSISGALGLIAGGALGNPPEPIRHLLDIAHKNSHRLALLIDDLLDMEKILAGKLVFNTESHALMPLVDLAIETNQSYGQRFNVQFVITERVEDVRVNVDVVRFEQVMANFLSNAAKFSAAGDTVEVAVHRLNHYVRVQVTDHGPGVPKEFHARIFQKFSQADASNTRLKSGTGLGLAISKELMERMNGRVGFESVEGRGATFFAELPIGVDGAK